MAHLRSQVVTFFEPGLKSVPVSADYRGMETVAPLTTLELEAATLALPDRARSQDEYTVFAELIEQIHNANELSRLARALAK